MEGLPVRPADAQLLREPWTFRAFQIPAWGPWIRFGESGPKNPPAPKVLGRDRPDGTRKRLQVYGGGIFRPKPPVFDRS